MGPDWRVEEVFANETERLSYLEKQGYLAQHTSRLNGNMVRVPIYMWNVLGSGLPAATARVHKPLYQIDRPRSLTTMEEICDVSTGQPGRHGKGSGRKRSVSALATVGRAPGRHSEI